MKTFSQGKSINPQWHPDGRRVYFVSDYNGASNVYLVDLESGALSQITNIDSGVSGITGLSPAISSAIDSRLLALSAYENGCVPHLRDRWAERLASAPMEVALPARLLVATLPPVERQPIIIDILSDAKTGLPGTTGDVEPYKASLSLDGVSQPYVSAGIDRFGGVVGGGIAFSFSDMLGNHTLYAQVERRHLWRRRERSGAQHRRSACLHQSLQALELGLCRRTVALRRRQGMPSVPNIEHVIVDGASKDHTLDIVHQFPHIKTIISERDNGLYDAMNKGIRHATGDIIGILNSDDFYVSPTVISEVVQKMIADQSESLYADLVFVNRKNTDIIFRYWHAGKYKTSHFLYGWMPPHPTFFVYRDLYNNMECLKHN